ncbi:heavy-metal-associated domain-containing protein [Calothrix rhizosoleniae]|uniref:heavy-metal-associated domain-containing protein n=1 Tax=Calothrix rhizosoleniae TaxID=888997 RepID=UPI000B498A41|nr:heavy-metal-associated domain-containing protein [Calothrix rhizosoleniae]
MTFKLKVPDIACQGCADTITESLLALEPSAKIQVDVPTKIVTVESTVSLENIKQAIINAGYQIE